MRTPNFNRVYDENLDFLYRCARRRGLADSDVDDVLQEVFIIAYRKLHTFEHRSTIQTWLYGILVNVSRDHARKHQKICRQKTALHDDPIRPLAEHANVDSKIDAAHLLAGFLRTLKSRDRLLFELFEFEQHTGQEVATALSIKLSTAYDRRNYLRRAFKSHIMSEAPARAVRVRDVVAASRRHQEAPPEARERIRGFVLASVGSKAVVAGPIGSLLHLLTTPAFGLAGFAAITAVAVGLEFARPTASLPSDPTLWAPLSGPKPEPEPNNDEPKPEPNNDERDPPDTSGDDRIDVVSVRRRPKPAVASTAKTDPVSNLPARAAPQSDESLIDTLWDIRTALNEGHPDVALEVLTSMDPPPAFRVRWTRLHVEALCGLERPVEARAIADKFELKHTVENCWDE